MLCRRAARQAKKHRRALGGLALALLLVLALGWTGYNLHHIMKNVPEYQIVHDGYTEKQTLYPKDPAAGLEGTLPKGSGQTLYGLRLMSATGGRVSHGSYTLELLTGETAVAGGTGDMTVFLDGAFVDLLFDAPAVLQPGESYRFRLSFAPDTPEDMVGLVYGEGELSNPELWLYDAAETPQGGRTAAMQYITNYTGQGFALRWFAPIALVLALVLLLGWWLIFVKKAKPETVFLVFALGLGFVFAAVTPPLAGPDEYVHAAGAYGMASRMTGGAGAEDDLLPMRAEDAAHMLDHSGPIGPIAYKNSIDGFAKTGVSPKLSQTAQVRSPISVQPVQYLAQSLGMLLARKLGLGFYPMLFLGRVFNLVLFALLAALAVRAAPVGKSLFFAAGLLPACLSLAGSLSADPAVIGLSFLFTALCLKGRYGDGAFGAGHCLVLAALALLLAPSKAIYLPVVLLCLMIPAKKLGGKTQAILWKAGILGAGLASWLSVNRAALASVFLAVDVDRIGLAFVGVVILAIAFALSWYLWNDRPFYRKAVFAGIGAVVLLGAAAAVWIGSNSGIHLTPEEYAASIQPNGESLYVFSVGYALSHPMQAVKLVLNTVGRELPVYLQGLLGSLPGEPIVHGIQLSWTLTIGLLLLVLAVSMRGANEPRRLTNGVRWGIGLTAAAVALLMIAACINWTPINSQVVFGIQGRYLLPVLPLFLLWLGDFDTFARKKDRSGALTLCSGLLGAAAALEALLLFAAG